MDCANILVLTYGTRGDVEPFVALALRFKERGHKPTLATAEQFGSWIASFGLDFEPLSNAALDMIHCDDGKMVLEGGSRWSSRMAAGARLARKLGPLNAQLWTDAWRAAQKAMPNLILYHPKVFVAPHIAEALGVPAMLGVLQPMIVPTSAFPAAGLPHVRIPGYNRATYSLVTLSYGAYRKSINQFRRLELGLPPVRRARDVLTPPGASAIDVLHAISPLVVARPDDWPAHACMTGYWWLPPDQDYKPPKALKAFLEAGDPPVYVGLGSMTVRDPAAFGRLVVDAVKIAGVRGVIGTGWAGIAGETDDVIAVEDVPHSWLFPRMAAVAHHGGAGTTAAGFRAGVPTVICPFFGDQPGWGKRSLALGVGVPPIARNRLTPKGLAASITEAVRNPAIRARAQHLAADLEHEDGVGIAASQIEIRLQDRERA